ncbi:lytic murein transglycosylase B [Neptunomonas antarctica]|uniref:Membrane-bound lytic murein transglycosylase B n=1 Tax=Neptunomonas antarctica TaxID=619304 RepID=A0A1N7J7E7_9GAMM|nr:lytic murein transglycosylase B [Neptunomonas antarctica]SIS45288.1 membrane-bound lytic murein transglycosylase B [Neptunomonas antarctica]
MRNNFTKCIGFLCVLLISNGVHAADSKGYSEHPEAEKWLLRMASEDFSTTYLRSVLEDAKKQDSILAAMNRPAEKRLDWGGYRQIFLQSKRIHRGVDFWQEHAETLARAAQVYGVPAEVIVAIIGIETHYGRNTGSYRALDALATLGFDYPRRADFFQEQLKDLLVLARNEKLNVADLKSSYAGAMGYGQFIPSSFLAYAVDFDGDGDKDLWNSPVDAIGSVANYFLVHGWQHNGEVVVSVTLEGTLPEEQINTGEEPVRPLSEWQALGVNVNLHNRGNVAAVLLRMKDQDKASYWLGLNNYYVITRYNRSRLYAMAVHELSQAIAAEKNAANSPIKKVNAE